MLDANGTLRATMIVFLLGLMAVLLPRGVAHGQEFSGEIGVELRGFPRSPLLNGQHDSNFSAYAMPEFYLDWDDGYHSLTITPFARFDAGDAERTHVDLREFYFLKADRNWEVRIGLVKVFWGVTESQHLVDVINQTDLVEGPDGEQKLGQPMVQYTWIPQWGTVDVFLLPWFRERTFPGEDGRLRFPFLVDDDASRFNRRLDLAVRWSHAINVFDIGLSHFWGTSREPRFSIGFPPNDGAPFLIPNYESIHQTGLDLQATVGGWLWKAEAISRSGQGDRFYALTGGFEYTFGNVRDTGIDIGVLAEYHYDSRDAVDFAALQARLFDGEETIRNARLAVSLFDNDTFIGTRLAFNDVQSTAILAGAVLDNNTGTTSLFLESNQAFR